MRMFKSVILSLFSLILVLTATGCGSNPIDGLRQAPITIQGTIQSIQITKDSPGTHKLIIKGDEFYLKSKDVDISKYTGQEVKVEGILSVDQNYKVIDVSNILSPDEVNSSSEPGDTKDFSFLGLSLSLPNQWLVDENVNNGIATIKNGNSIYAEISLLGTKSFDPMEWLTIRGYEKPSKILDSDGFSIYRASPLNLYIFNTKHDIYNFVLKTSDPKIQELIISALLTIKSGTGSTSQTPADSDTKQTPYFPEPTKDTVTKEADRTPKNDAEQPANPSSPQATVPISSDMRLFQSDRFGYSMGYPKNWYFSGIASSGDEIHHIIFSPTPDEENLVIESRLFKTKDIPSTFSDSKTTYIKKALGDSYTIILNTSQSQYIEAMKKMLDSALLN